MAESRFIAAIVVASLYVLFQTTVVALIIWNKLRSRRGQKKLALASGYKSLDSDIELAPASAYESSISNTDTTPHVKDVRDSIAQLPTGEDGEEDLTGRPRLEFEGNPVYQLENNEQPQAPFELQDDRTSERLSRQPIPSVHVEFLPPSELSAHTMPRG
ncbi:hypothetical protein BDV95DRAFT_608408 [Massariosphaeria phaeospora]|uniref:Uncharacterized protein n=1 Tax=Massariosphaeria phaeospora TaxID=100035 RepID=A0A7C8I7W2_9PLEO|nr:hypothetical protein BDV95DRAFT_608408 [Massariosphaeria phaeospora]